MKVLIDTNIIIDATNEKSSFYKESLGSILALKENNWECYITASSFTDIYYLIHKIYHDYDEAKKVTFQAMNLFDILDVKSSDVYCSFVSNVSDIEDALIESVAYRNKMDYILTRDKDFKKSKVKSISPKELLKMFNSK